MNTDTLTAELKEYALSQGVDLIGVTSARPFVKRDKAKTFIDPKELLEDAQSVVVTAFYNYNIIEGPVPDADIPRGRFPRADRMGALTPMTDHCEAVIKGFLEGRGYKAVTNASHDYRLPEKMAAVRAGIGKYGKNGVILTREYGSYVRLVTLVTDAPLAYEEYELYASDCGDCDLCIKACPTGAIYEPYRVRQDMCITDWLWGTFIPIPLREKQENRLFGCGLCVEACPRNQELAPRKEYPVKTEDACIAPELIPLVTGDEDFFRKSLPSFPMQAGMDALRGNAIIALGNSGTDKAVEPLCLALTHPNRQIRAYAAWALGRRGGARAEKALEKALEGEADREVRKEMALGLGR